MLRTFGFVAAIGAAVLSTAAAQSPSVTIRGTVNNSDGSVSTFGPATLPLTVFTPPSGGGGQPPGGGGNVGDGSSGAPAGTPQLPGLLSGYAVRPPWNVAGVAYHVGIPQGTVLKDPFAGGVLASALVALGGSATTSNHVITFSGINNAVINGWDFSLEGGWTVLVNSNNATIENSNFKVGANLRHPIQISPSANNVTIINNIIDGAGLNTNNGAGMLMLNAQGATTIEYNFVKNAYYQFIEGGDSYGSTGGPTLLQNIQYNVFQNAGLGFAQGAHGDWIQDFATPDGVFNNIQINFNTFIQDLPDTAARTQGLSIMSAGGNKGSALQEGISNNTFVISGPSHNQVNYPIIVETTWLNGSAIVGNNYFDLTGINGNWLFAGQYNPVPGPHHGTVAKSNNINMLTGATLQ